MVHTVDVPSHALDVVRDEDMDPPLELMHSLNKSALAGLVTSACVTPAVPASCPPRAHRPGELQRQPRACYRDTTPSQTLQRLSVPSHSPASSPSPRRRPPPRPLQNHCAARLHPLAARRAWEAAAGGQNRARTRLPLKVIRPPRRPSRGASGTSRAVGASSVAPSSRARSSCPRSGRPHSPRVPVSTFRLHLPPPLPRRRALTSTRASSPPIACLGPCRSRRKC